MILTCPECDTRFVVPSTIFANGGRQLKCSTCKHKWFQNDPSKEVDFKPEDIIRGSRPQSKHKNESQGGIFEKIKGDFANGRIVIVVTTAIIVGLFFIYGAMQTPLIMAQGLAFDQITITRTDNVAIVTGNIVNAMNDKRGVPSIKITQIMAGDVEGDVILLAPEKSVLASGEIMNFTATIDDISASVQNLRVTFQGDGY